MIIPFPRGKSLDGALQVWIYFEILPWLLDLAQLYDPPGKFWILRLGNAISCTLSLGFLPKISPQRTRISDKK
jgi:hypothetical protein